MDTPQLLWETCYDDWPSSVIKESFPSILEKDKGRETEALVINALTEKSLRIGRKSLPSAVIQQPDTSFCFPLSTKLS